MSLDAMKQALEALENGGMLVTNEAIVALQLAIEKEEALSALIAESQALGAYDVPKAERQEPVGWVTRYGFELARTTIFSGESIAWRIPVYTAPPQRLPDYVWCGCGDGIMPNTGAKCGTCASIDAAPPQRQPLTEEEVFKAVRPLYQDDHSCRMAIELSMSEYRAIERKHGIGGGE